MRNILFIMLELKIDIDLPEFDSEYEKLEYVNEAYLTSNTLRQIIDDGNYAVEDYDIITVEE